MIVWSGVMTLASSTQLMEGPGTGWTVYPPLACVEYHASTAVDLVVFTVHLLGISSLLNSLNAIGTAIGAKSLMYYATSGSLVFIPLCD